MLLHRGPTGRVNTYLSAPLPHYQTNEPPKRHYPHTRSHGPGMRLDPPRISLEPEEAVEVERTPLIRLYRPVVLADPPEHRVLPNPHVILEEYGDFPMEEYGRTEGV